MPFFSFFNCNTCCEAVNNEHNINENNSRNISPFTSPRKSSEIIHNMNANAESFADYLLNQAIDIVRNKNEEEKIQFINDMINSRYIINNLLLPGLQNKLVNKIKSSFRFRWKVVKNDWSLSDCDEGFLKMVGFESVDEVNQFNSYYWLTKVSHECSDVIFQAWFNYKQKNLLFIEKIKFIHSDGEKFTVVISVGNQETERDNIRYVEGHLYEVDPETWQTLQLN